MSKIFVVTSGDYSDYHISGVFSSRKLAEAWIHGAEDPYSEYAIEEWNLDERSEDRRITCWQCGILLESGQIVEGPISSEDYRKPFRGEVVQHAVKPPCYSGRAVSRVRSAISAEHCLKLAAEERQAWLRECGNNAAKSNENAPK